MVVFAPAPNVTSPRNTNWLLLPVKPRRIVEVGSGFSSAVMLDTLERVEGSAALTFIEPHPDRLYSLLSPQDRPTTTVVAKQVQEVPLALFDELEAQDVLFIDSSHVCKIGSDVAFLLLRVLPRLKRGVLVHFHDVFYPFTYPDSWIREGRAWNEALFLRTLLMGNAMFQIVAFNSYAACSFAEVFRDRFPAFLRFVTAKPGTFPIEWPLIAAFTSRSRSWSRSAPAIASIARTRFSLRRFIPA